MHDLHHLDLVELVLADHAARVLAVAAGLRAKARRVRGQLDRQRRERQDLLADRVGQRDLRRGNEVLRLAGFASLADGEHVGLEFRQLGRAHQRVGADDVRRVALGVAMLARLRVEHELPERAVQQRNVAAQERKARARDLRRGGEVDLPQRLA